MFNRTCKNAQVLIENVQNYQEATMNFDFGWENEL